MNETRSAGDLARASDQSQFLTFMLGTEVFAMRILAIKEIIEYGNLTEVPMMPGCVRGVINLRGAVVPVMDLAVRFGKPASQVTKRTCIVIVETARDGHREVIGVVVDAVNAVLEISSSDIEPPPAFGPRIRTEFVEGLGKVDGRFVILLATERVLAIEGMMTAADAAAPPPAIVSPALHTGA